MTTAKVAGLAALVSIFSTSCKQGNTDVHWHGHPTTIDVDHSRVIEHVRSPFSLTDDTTFIADFAKNEFIRVAPGGMFDFKNPVKTAAFSDVSDSAVERKIAGMRLLLENAKFQRGTK